MISTGGPRNSAPGTLNQLFFKACERRKPDALQVKRDGRYQPISHDMLKDRVRRASLGLDALGVRPGDRVAILSTNRPEWVDRRPRLSHDGRGRRARSTRTSRPNRRRTSCATRAPWRSSCRTRRRRPRSRRSAASVRRCATSSRSTNRAGGDIDPRRRSKRRERPSKPTRRARRTSRARTRCVRTTSRRSSTRRARRASRRA